MRLIVFFDLPTITATDRKNYRIFRKFLIKTGFTMVQFSVYSKLLLNNTAEKLMKNKIRQNKPPSGLVQMMTITEKQYGKMEFVTGYKQGDILDTDERLVFL